MPQNRSTRVMAGVLAMGLLALTGCQSSSPVWLSEVFQPGSSVRLLTVFSEHAVLLMNPRNVTAARCGEQLSCVEAFTTDEANYYRFETVGEAEALDKALGASSARSNFIVVEFVDPSLSMVGRTRLQSLVEGAHT